MSGTLAIAGAALAAVSDLFGSRARLLPASFRGVPFYVDSARGAGGRRRIDHEFPLRDTPYLEDIGKLPRKFRLAAFVVEAEGDAYIDARDALIDACEGYDTAATFIHPTMGPMTCRSGVLTWSERFVQGFGLCQFELDFALDGPIPGPLFTADTASSLLGALHSALPILCAAYSLAVLAIEAPAALLAEAAGVMLGLPAGTILGLADTIGMVSAAPTDAPATAAAVQAATQAMAANIIDGAAPSTAATDAVTGTPFTIDGPADLSGGLAGLATWGAALPAIPTTTALGVALAAQQALVVQSVQGNAVAALAQVYASVVWPYAQAAADARTQLLGLMDAQSDLAAQLGADDLFRAWEGLKALAMADMIARAQSLPTLGSYAAGDATPSLALAQRLYQDPARAGELEQLNDVSHPLFMPPIGAALLAAA